MPHAIERLELGGKDLTMYLAKLLQEKGCSFSTQGNNIYTSPYTFLKSKDLKDTFLDLKYNMLMTCFKGL